MSASKAHGDIFCRWYEQVLQNGVALLFNGVHKQRVFDSPVGWRLSICLHFIAKRHCSFIHHFMKVLGCRRSKPWLVARQWLLATTGVPEVLGDAALLVDPMNVNQSAVGIERSLFDQSLRTKLRERGIVRSRQFDWIKSDRSLLDILDRFNA